jgi:hypothetical protein
MSEPIYGRQKYFAPLELGTVLESGSINIWPLRGLIETVSYLNGR